jgi:hypothetical protein
LKNSFLISNFFIKRHENHCGTNFRWYRTYVRGEHRDHIIRKDYILKIDR